ncbi:uncharacterized protein BDW43DRAFT_290570 [Aspergillus alliaceus]|uniref:uncharacterized protein n=1 Tax=Petromyces alliaceus TaxID=209559 RepID=UPI0012A62090|nr:uncharacterized protein BDW43DRAFT_290570 [Aspergillus alliaceus]KAB8228655.1 hypothetical protein BDW43DRAFT_290570 [Aspergillus alliaceus]
MFASFAVKEWHIVLIGVIKLALSAILVAGIAMQSKVLPGTFSGCRSTATSWHEALPLDMRDSRTATEASLHSACKTMVEHWAFAIAIVVLYLFYSLVIILYGARGIMYPRPPRYSRPKPIKPEANVQAGIYFAVRYMSKFFQRLRSRSGKPPVQAVTRRGNRKNHRSNIWTSTNRGEKLPCHHRRVLPSKVLLNIASHVHYVDIVNLHTAYGNLFRDYIGNEDEESKVEELRIYTCTTEGIKEECRVCRTQICKSCCTSVPIPQTIPLEHLETCKLYCSTCFYRDYNLKASSSCWLNATKEGGTSTYRKVCRDCAAMTDAEICRIVELQDQVEMYKFSKYSLFCAECKNQLPPSGPRWWVCSCGRECRHHVHPPWGLGSNI